MSSRLEIWRGAFTGLTGGRLESLDDPNAEPLADVYPSLVSEALSRKVWPWTLHRAALARQAAPDYPEQYRYPYPGDILGAGPLVVYDDEMTWRPTLEHWRNEGGAIYTDLTYVAIQYQRRTAEETWPEPFAAWVRKLIKAELRGSPFGDASLRPSEIREAEKQLAELVSSVAQTVPQQVLFDRFQTTAGRGDGYYPLRRIDRSRIGG